MRLVKYNPFDEFFNDTFLRTKADGVWYPAVDILNEKDHVVLNVELPGLKKENILVNIEDRVLTIKGERKFEHGEKKDSYFRKERSYGSFKRTFRLSDDVLINDVNADYTDGVLKVTLKKDTAREAVKQITIN